MEERYYTPKIEEFYIGFEYEYLHKDNWISHEVYCYTDIQDAYYDIELNKIRVKYLDSSDIESFGFTRFSYNNESSVYRLGGYASEVLDMLLNYPDIIDINVNNSNVSKLKITKGVFNINKEVYE